MSKLIYKPVATESPTSLSDDNTQSFTELKQLTPSQNHHHVQIKTPMEKKRKKWQEFPGRTSFLCDGRLVMSHERKVFYLTIFLIVSISLLFFIFDCPYLATHVSLFIPITGGTLFIFVLSTLLRTSSIDPGIIPRATKEEASYLESLIEVVDNEGGERSFKAPPRTRQLTINGSTVSIKYCFTCKIFRPPRASHCSVCDNCVDRFDHHCPWVGNCVGSRNYRYFYLFLLSLSIHSSFIFSFSFLHVYSLSKSEGIFVGLRKSPASLIELIVCFMSMWSVIGLTIFHTYLIFTNTTTNEDMKGGFPSNDDSSPKNPFSKGNVLVNYCSIVCGPLPPSLIHSRAFFQPEGSYVPTAITTSPTITTVAEASFGGRGSDAGFGGGRGCNSSGGDGFSSSGGGSGATEDGGVGSGWVGCSSGGREGSDGGRLGVAMEVSPDEGGGFSGGYGGGDGGGSDGVIRKENTTNVMFINTKNNNNNLKNNNNNTLKNNNKIFNKSNDANNINNKNNNWANI